MKILFISNLFPDRTEPHRGLDNARLLRRLAATHEVRVIAARPSLSLGRASPPVALSEDAALAPVYVPVRYLPKVGSRVNHHLFGRSLRPTFERVVAANRPDVVLCAWLYPDGCAVTPLCRAAELPCVLIAQGSDVHQYLSVPPRRRAILAAAGAAAAVITRSRDLATRLDHAGVAAERLHPIYNGVDTDLFRPGDQAAARRALDLATAAEWLLFVGNLLPVKNPQLLLQALSLLRRRRAQVSMVLVGDGALRGELVRTRDRLGLTDAVRIAGRQPPAVVAEHMRAADALVLASRNEGLPNVVLEALASGLPVVAPRVGGLGEAIDSPAYGCLVAPTCAEALARGMEAVLAGERTSHIIRVRGRCYSWAAAEKAYIAVLTAAARR